MSTINEPLDGSGDDTLWGPKSANSFAKILLESADPNWATQRQHKVDADSGIEGEHSSRVYHGCDAPRRGCHYSPAEKEVIQSQYKQAQKDSVKVKWGSVADALLRDCGTTRSPKAIYEKWRNMKQQEGEKS